MYRELEEEVGITARNVEVMIPVALCREFLRGGKPQIFYVGITTLSKEALATCRKKAIEHTIKRGLPPEIHDELCLFDDDKDLLEDIGLKGLTIEAIGNIQYVDRFRLIYDPLGRSSATNG